jgi:hypothetical protein
VTSAGGTRVGNKLAAHLRHGKLAVDHLADSPAQLWAIIVANLEPQPGSSVVPQFLDESAKGLAGDHARLGRLEGR